MDFQLKFISLPFLVSAILIGIVSSYPTHVPNSPDVCSKMTPGHGPRPQTTPAPFQIKLDKQSMSGGKNLQIVLRGTKGRKFKGFYMQARDIDGIPIGTFQSPDENEAGTHGCHGQKNNAIHHKNAKEKGSITVYWKAPENFEGQVRIIATVVKDFQTYWTNVQAPELVSVSNISDSFFIASPPFPETREEESSKFSKTYRILNYNPYSPFPPLSSWNRDMDIRNENSSTEFLLPQASEQSSVSSNRERQLLGPASFDFHGGLYTSKVPGRKPKVNYPPRFPHQHHHHVESSPVGPSSINEQLPPLPHHHHHNHIDSKPFLPSSPTNSIFKNGPEKLEVKERHPSYPLSKEPQYPQMFPPVDNPYPFYFPSQNSDIQKNPVHFAPPPKPYDSFGYPPPPLAQPHYSQSIYDKNNGHYIVDHHYISPTIPSIKPVHFPPSNLHHHHKPSSDPSYPNSGYFPKDILTRLTSYIPNIYNALTHNPLFNFNVDNTIESIWKPSKGILQTPQKHSILTAAATPSKVGMPKYGYLIYNPVRGNPYYVIPAENEDEFVANHIIKR